MKVFKISLLLLIFSSILTTQGFASSVRRTAVVEVVQNWGGSVVNIGTERLVLLRKQPFWRGYGGTLDEMMQDFTDQHAPGAVRVKSLGSGVVVRKEGIIVTNAHVVNMASRIFVRFQDGTSVEGKVILVNQNDDLAFIKIQPPFELKPVKLADPEGVMTGETVISIGNPMGLENSVSTGVISGKGRSFVLPGSRHIFKDLLQTDASINFGSSGGALLNLDGELAGVNLAVVQNAQNIGFAVSSRKIREGLEYYDRRQAQLEPVPATVPAAQEQQPVRIPVR